MTLVLQPGYRATTASPECPHRLLNARKDGACGHDDPGHDYPVLGHPIVGGSLFDVEGESIVAFSEIFDVVETADINVLNNKSFYERRLLGMHFGYPPAGYMSLQGSVKTVNTAPANHENNTAGYVIAEYTGSIPAFCQNFPQICNQLASLFNRKYYSADDTAFLLYVNHADYSDVSVDGFDGRAGREGITRDDRFRDWIGFVSLSHRSHSVRASA